LINFINYPSYHCDKANVVLQGPHQAGYFTSLC